MLSTLLSQVGTVLSRLFIFSSFVPTLMFTFVNGTLLYLWNPGFHEWLAPQLQGAALAFYFATAIVAMAIIAYILFTLNNSLRVILERCEFLPPPLRNVMSTSEERRLQGMVQEYLTARNDRRQLERLRSNDNRLSTAIDRGAALNTNTYDAVKDPAALALRELEQAMTKNKMITAAQVDSAIVAFAAALSANNKDLPPNAAHPLDDQHGRLLVVIEYAVTRCKFTEEDTFNRQQFSFGVRTPLPTRLGNIAESLQGYGLTRYHLNLDVVWTRFFNALRGCKDAFATIEDAKTQLDFLVACCWLSALSTLAWTALLGGWGYSVAAFLWVTLLGPAITYMFYMFSVRSYAVFADVVRTAIDQYRFKILDSMALAIPCGLRDERQMWEAVESLIGKGGDYLEISYRSNPAPTPPMPPVP